MNLLQKHILLIFSLALSVTGFTQNLISKDGLKYGYWNGTTYGERKGIEAGTYKIISKKKYKLNVSVDKGRGGIGSTTYINSYAILWYDNASDDSISVKDGIWNRYDSSGKLALVINHHEGIWLDITSYDLNGNISSRYLPDHNRNFSYDYEYENSRLLKTVFHPSLAEGASQTTYYPNDNLSINNAEPYMKCIFGIKPSDTFELKLGARKKAVKIKSIITPSENFKILNSEFKELSLPIKIVNGETKTVNIIYTPTPPSAKETEEISIITNDSKNNDYKITVNTTAFHFDTEAAEKGIDSIILVSKLKDKFLRIPVLGTVWGITIIDDKGKVSDYSNDVDEMLKIDLSAFKAGQYQFIAHACNVYSSMVLIVKD